MLPVSFNTQIISKDNFPFQLLPMEIQQRIVEYLDLNDVNNLTRFLINPALLKILWQNSREVPFSNLQLSRKSVIDLSDDIRRLTLKGKSTPGLLSITTRITALKIHHIEIEGDLKTISTENRYSSLTSLEISGHETNEPLTIISASPLSSRLKSLKLKKITNINDVRYFNNLHTLDLSRCIISKENLHSLFENNNIQNLENLRLVNCDLNSDSISVLTFQPLTKLKSLHLDINPTGNVGAQIWKSTILTNLTELSLFYNYTQFYMNDLSTLTRLKSLNVSKNLHFNSKVSTDHLPLTDVDFSYVTIPDAFLWSFIKEKNRCLLRKLNLDDSRFNLKTIYKIFNESAMTALKELDLRGNRITDTQAYAIAYTTIVTNLTFLGLANNELTVMGVNFLVLSTNLQNLIKLDVRGNDLSGVPESYKDTFPELVM